MLVLYLIGFSQLGKFLFGLWVIWVGVWVIFLCQLDKDKEGNERWGQRMLKHIRFKSMLIRKTVEQEKPSYTALKKKKKEHVF